MNHKKIIYYIVFFLSVFGLFLFLNAADVKAVDVNSMTVTQLQALIQQLQAQIALLQQQLAQVQGQSTVSWCHTFNTNLKYGDTGTEVQALQTVLQKEGFLSQTTNEYDENTASAVTGFQEKYKDEVLTPWRLAHGTGYAGSKTIAKLNKLYGCGILPTPIVAPTPTIPTSTTSTPTPTPTGSYMKIIYPNGGEQIPFGSALNIKWNSSGLENAYIYLWFQDGGMCKLADVPAGNGIYSVLITEGMKCSNIPSTISAGKYKIQILTEKTAGPASSQYDDSSDDFFTIGSPVPGPTSVTCARDENRKGVTCGGYFYEDYCDFSSTGAAHSNIRKCNAVTGTDCSYLVNVDRNSCSYGCVYGACVSTTTPPTCEQVIVYAKDPNTGECQQFPSSCVVPPSWTKVNSCPTSTSSPFIKVVSPNGGESFSFGSTMTINWISSGVKDANIYLWFPDGGMCYLTKVPAVTGSYSITLTDKMPCPGMPATISAGKYKIQILTELPILGPGSASDASDDFFDIVATTNSTSFNNFQNQLANISSAVLQLSDAVKEFLNK